MKMKSLSLSLLMAVVCTLWGVSVCSGGGRGRGEHLIRMKSVGSPAFDSSSDSDILNLAQFAVQQHNQRENAFLELAKVLKAKEQVVAGKIYHLTLEVADAHGHGHGQNTVYEAKVWVKPWINFKQLLEFKLAHDGPKLGWKTVPTNDPKVQDAAKYAIKSLQQRSNSLFPYELREILLAKIKVIQDYIKFELLLKLRRGNEEENLKVDITKDKEGKFHIN